MRDLEEKGEIRNKIWLYRGTFKFNTEIPRVAIHETFGFQPNKCH